MKSRAVFLSLIAALASAFAAAPAAERPNIVLCMADDQGWGDIGHRDPKLKTPVLDEMASSGLRFDRFYAAAPVCSPTRGSVLTGRHPNRFGCFSWGHSLRPQEITLAEVLQKAGYATGHFGKWHLGPVDADSPVNPGHSGFDRWVSAPNFYDNDALMSEGGRVAQHRGESSMIAVDAALPFLRESAAAGKPFFAVIWFGSPHAPHQGSAELNALYPDEPRGKQNFYAEMTGIDRAMGKLREALKAMGAAENTLLWYNSDNGALPVGSTGGLSGKKGDLGEGGIRVPAMIEWPARIKAPRVTEVPASTVDIYPTALAAAGVALPENQPPLDGIDLSPLLDGQMESRPQPLGFWVHPTGGISTPSEKILAQALADQQAGGTGAVADPRSGTDFASTKKQYPEDEFPGPAAWIDGDWKLAVGGKRKGGGAPGLYHLKDDPTEKNDLSAKEPERAEAMAKQLAAWRASVARSLNGKDY
ncbi:MAG: sulfatase-like hydrolase/transferase [Verrucomicrobiales bacterium]